MDLIFGVKNYHFFKVSRQDAANNDIDKKKKVYLQIMKYNLTPHPYIQYSTLLFFKNNRKNKKYHLVDDHQG